MGRKIWNGIGLALGIVLCMAGVLGAHVMGDSADSMATLNVYDLNDETGATEMLTDTPCFRPGPLIPGRFLRRWVAKKVLWPGQKIALAEQLLGSMRFADYGGYGSIHSWYMDGISITCDEGGIQAIEVSDD